MRGARRYQGILKIQEVYEEVESNAGKDKFIPVRVLSYQSPKRKENNILLNAASFC
jgi:hypothetical protein